MIKVRMLRERLYKMKEFEIDPNDPDHILSDGEVFGNETDEGCWNEYYRVGYIDTKVDYSIQDEMFQDTAQDFYSHPEAKKCYDEMVEALKDEELVKKLEEEYEYFRDDRYRLLRIRAEVG